MSDSSERLHLEGLDEATERERWEEATSPARDDAVETVHNHVPGVTSTACPACKASQEDGVSAPETRQGGFYPSVDPPASVGALSPARDDARREAEGSWKNWVPSMFADDENMHTAYVAGYMAAPDELTALRGENDALIERVNFQKDEMARLARKAGVIGAERDALRERIRALADEWERTQVIGNNTYAAELRAALGDA